MPAWKGVVVRQSNLDSNGTSEIIFDILKDNILKFNDSVVRAAVGAEVTVVRAELTKRSNEDAAFVALQPGTEILLP